jgi:sulfofructose kinase
MERGTKTPRHQEAFKVDAADTTGCGDVFHGAYAFGLARHLSLEERVRLASAAAASKASHGGGNRRDTVVGKGPQIDEP